jgi:7,8-dihydroneopterin aldolase/epimerase/oxygenase
MMALIAAEGMRFHAFHGLLDEEQKICGEYVVDAYIHADLGPASESYSIENTVDYSSIYALVKEEMSQSSRLIESVAQRILNRAMKQFENIQRLEIKVTKINPPVGGSIDRVSVTLHAGRNQ